MVVRVVHQAPGVRVEGTIISRLRRPIQAEPSRSHSACRALCDRKGGECWHVRPSVAKVASGHKNAQTLYWPYFNSRAHTTTTYATHSKCTQKTKYCTSPCPSHCALAHSGSGRGTETRQLRELLREGCSLLAACQCCHQRRRAVASQPPAPCITWRAPPRLALQAAALQPARRLPTSLRNTLGIGSPVCLAGR